MTDGAPMLRVAVPNKGALSESAAEILSEAGYRRDPHGRIPLRGAARRSGQLCPPAEPAHGISRYRPVGACHGTPATTARSGRGR